MEEIIKKMVQLERACGEYWRADAAEHVSTAKLNRLDAELEKRRRALIDEIEKALTRPQ